MLMRSPLRNRSQVRGRKASPAETLRTVKSLVSRVARSLRFGQFAKFCLVGATGVIVDMVVLHCLVKWLGASVSIGKLCSAEVAMLNNFFWNEIWTFRGPTPAAAGESGLIFRLLKFQAICGAGIGLAVLLLNLFYRHLGINLYAANLLAILLVTLWNFWMNALFNWGAQAKRGSRDRPQAAPAPATWRERLFRAPTRRTEPEEDLRRPESGAVATPHENTVKRGR